MAQLLKIRKGLELPIAGAPEASISDAPPCRRVAVLGPDYIGMRPTMAVREGDTVKRGQLLFTDKKSSSVCYTAPTAGTVSGVLRGAKRLFQAVVIDVAEHDDEENFGVVKEPEALTREELRDKLLQSGLWPALRARPYSKVADPDTVPHSLFVTATDTNPLAPPPELVAAPHAEAFRTGLYALSKLTEGHTYLCRSPGSAIPSVANATVRVVEFEGPHPAGLVGTHIHFLDPVGPKKIVWHIGYQDVIAVGKLLTTGSLFTERVVSVAGPGVSTPRLVLTHVGASTDELTEGNLRSGDLRTVSGSILSGRIASGPTAYLGRYHQQVTVLREGRQRDLLGWMSAGANKFSIKNTVLSRLAPKRKFAFTTSLEGSPRAMVPIGMYEKVMPLDIVPTYLLRALIVGDTDQAQALGCMELDEEDLSLCTFVCTGKYDYGSILRRNLMTIEKDG
jgi:Na+-transporting NADH:ubiquinone oxidoreductase subunit A